MDTEEKEFYNAVLIAAAIIGAIMLYFIVSMIMQHRKSRRVSKDRISAEIKTLENERRRIASDLHDEIGPLLSAVKFQIAHLDAKTEEMQSLVDSSGKHIDTIIQRMREISTNLMPYMLERKGLVWAIQDFINRIQQDGTLKIIFKHHLTGRFNQDIELNVYRIVQEILHNTLKHAKASSLRIVLEENEGVLRLQTTDNGIGFNFQEMIKQHSGLGLLNLQSRIEVMKGTIKMFLASNGGTGYTFEIPVKGGKT
ncbi:sensor histidine kinase [Pedobacter punctiformis]|uniref:Histidine kinase n=1 Tax=Pedobacter punctiformis TaxID=3004097 RepID=A0ABT4L8V9_9SPHI|nr:ATP-binding protein [Pedobacter sp. HCMS5-2]MCZ4244344.1 histidine kinase [Pedobacter sp. HCMS5-2]